MIVTPILATSILTACHSSNIEGEYVNPSNPKQTLRVALVKDQWGINDDKPFYFLTESMPCNYRNQKIGVNVVDGKLIDVHDHKTAMGSIDDNKIIVNWQQCSITYVKE